MYVRICCISFDAGKQPYIYLPAMQKKRPVRFSSHGTIGESLYILFGCIYNIQKLFQIINNICCLFSRKKNK